MSASFAHSFLVSRMGDCAEVKEMRRMILQGIEQKVFPGAVVCMSRHGDPQLYEAHGFAELVPNERKMKIDTRFDLSGLTMVVATMPAVLRSIQAGKLSLVDPIVHYLPEFATGVDRFTKAQITVFHLLTHTSGLPAWRPYYLHARGQRAYLRALADTPLESAPGVNVTVSDLGYMLLGFALERIWDRSLDEVCERLVFGPLDLHQTCFAGAEGLPQEMCAATEEGNEYERRLAEQLGAGNFPWRGNTICGEAHDANCFYGLDGVSGHAGVFSTASDLNRFAEMWVRKGVYMRERYLDSTLISLATSGHSASLGYACGFGWELAGPAGGAGEGVPKNSFGYGGWTGATLWCDPVSKRTAVLLTNAVHPHVHTGFGPWREEFLGRAFQE
jgi:CubicO group peptidase (beta-lactamase class C family)